MTSDVTHLLTDQVARNIRIEQVRMLYRQAPRGLVITALAMTVLCFGLFNGAPLVGLTLWWLVMVSVLTVRYLLVRQFNSLQDWKIEPEQWERYFIIGTGLTGLVWGLGGALIAPHVELFYQALIFMVIAAMVGAAISFLGSVFNAYLIYLITATVPILVWCVLQWNLIYGTTSLLVCLFIWGTWKAMANFHGLLAGALRSQFEKIDLAEQLEDANKQLQHDISEILRAEQTIRESEERLRGMFEEGLVGMAVLSLNGTFQRVNQAFCDFLGYDSTELVGCHFSKIIHAEENQVVNDQLQKLLDAKITGYQDEGRYVHKSGRDVYGLSAMTALRDAHDRAYSVIFQVQDITEERRMAQELEFQARHDELTGLVNRREFQRRLELALDTARLEGSQHALCCVDLDQFKIVNDSVGHFAGDELLKEVSKVMRGRIRRQDTLARIGGDEFGLLLESCSLKKAAEISAGLTRALHDFRFEWDSRTFEIRGSIGVVPITASTQNAVELMKHADMACYTAKDQGGNRCYVYPSASDYVLKQSPEIMRLTRWLEAFHDDRFQLYAQPIRPLAAKETSIEWYELLLRLIDDNGEAISPVSLIPAAERYGQMTRIDRWVIESALRWYHEAVATGLGVRLSLNISGTSMADDAFAEFIKDQLKIFSLAPGSVCFEITETAAIRNLKEAQRLIGDLKSRGCLFALDDFGSGLSSFTYLKYLNVDYLKIDGNFVQDMTEDKADRAMVAAINQVGTTLGMQTIAESVGSDDIVEQLRQLGVDYGQGNFLGSPVALEDIATEKLLTTPRTAVSSRIN